MKKGNVLMLLIGAIVLFMSACTTTPAEPMIDQAKVKEEISAISQTWAKALNERDTETILAMFADDAKFYPANQSPRIGKAAQTEAMEGMAQDTSGWTIAFTTNEVIAAGDYANEIGSWEMSAADGSMIDKGNYFVIFRKQDGKYMVTHDIFNSEMPLPEPMADATETGEEEG